MTDLGRGSGSEPWHPGDPLYGDPDWATQGAPTGSWDQYGNPYPQPQPQSQPQPLQPQQPGQFPPGQFPPEQGWGAAPDPSASYGMGPGDPYGQPPADPYGGAGPDQYGRPDPYGRQDPYPSQDQYGQYPLTQDPYGQPDGYGGGAGPGPGPDPYGQPDPYTQQPGPGYDQHDPYGHQQEPPRAPHREDQDLGRRRRPEPGDEPDREGDGRDPHPFFADDGDDDLDDDLSGSDEGGRRKGRNKGKKKGKTRRSGCACLVVLLVLGGGVGTVGWFGYDFYQSRFGAAPDYSGEGKGSVQIEIPEGAFSADIGKILFDNGVVKSTQAFVDAAQNDDQAARSIQPGVYTLKKEMSAASALKLLTDTKNLNSLIIAEGLRATKVYEAIDAKLGLKKGTTKAAAKDADLGLPKYAKGNPEGFLYPSRYSVGDNTKPVDLLKKMVKQAEAEYSRDDLEEAAEGVGRSPYEVIVIASIIQAEAQEEKDFGKVSRVIYNRLNTDATLGRLDMDSTINYALNRSTLDTSNADTKLDHPYNTYVKKGLPPGPIGNPGHQAIEAALNPTKGDWVYFVTVKPGDTRFTKSKAEHDKNVAEFNKNQREGDGG